MKRGPRVPTDAPICPACGKNGQVNAMTITRKFALLLFVGIVLVQTVSAMIRIRREIRLVQTDVSRHEESVGRALARAAEATWKDHGEAAALQLVEHAARGADVEIRWVWVPAAAGDKYAPRVGSARLTPLASGAPLLVRRAEESNVLYTYVPVRVPDGRPGAIEISTSLAVEYDYMEETVTTVSATALVLALLTTGFAWVLGARLIGAPMKELVDQARRVGGGDFGSRLNPVRSDEIGQLGREMDRMCDGLETAWKRVRTETQARFSALEQLRHADRLTTVGTLASGVAHELGTPLNVIDGHAQLIREDPVATDEQKEHANVISRQCKRMTTIIRQLLDFARRGRGAEGPSELRSVVRDTLRMVEPMARARHVEIVVAPGDDEVWARIGVEPMQQVLANLILNGVHAMTSRGTLSVRVAHEPTDDGGSGHNVRVDVEDTGAGMDEETIKRIFEPFFTTKGVGEGTGLGLSVAHGIVEDHGGRIDVESEPGRGSRFSVIVPGARQ